MGAMGVQLISRCCLGLLVAALVWGEIVELSSEPQPPQVVPTSIVDIGDGVTTGADSPTADDMAAAREEVAATQTRQANYDALYAAKEAKNKGDAQRVKEHEEKTMANHAARYKAKRDSDAAAAALHEVHKEKYIKALPPTNKDPSINNPWAVQGDYQKIPKHPQNDEANRFTSDADAARFATQMAHGAQQRDAARRASDEQQAKGINNSREKDWKNKTKAYANASHFAADDEEWAAMAGGYGADLVAKAKEQQNDAVDSQKAQLDQANKMKAEADMASGAEMAQRKADKDLDDKKTANDAAIEKKAKDSIRRNT